MPKGTPNVDSDRPAESTRAPRSEAWIASETTVRSFSYAAASGLLPQYCGRLGSFQTCQSRIGTFVTFGCCLHSDPVGPYLPTTARAKAAIAVGTRGGSTTLDLADRLWSFAHCGALKRIGSTAIPCLAAARTKRSVKANRKRPRLGSMIDQSKVCRKISTPSCFSCASVAS